MKKIESKDKRKERELCLVVMNGDEIGKK